jgi:glycosyltransferase involved in cell wall biosynthesis
MRRKRRRLVSISHSYCVALNRRLAHEMARAGGEEWQVTAVAPRFIRGDLRPIPMEHTPDELCEVEAVGMHLTRSTHTMLYERRTAALLRQRWDLVHCWEEPFNPAAFQIARWTQPGVPLVYWTAQNIAKRYPPPFSWIERYTLRRMTAWLACGESTVHAQLHRGYAHHPHRVMPLGVDVERFRPDASARSRILHHLAWNEDGPPVVGYLGRFVPEKGLRLLMSSLDRVHAPWRALLLGGGPLAAELRSWGARHGDRVRVVESVTHDEVPAWLNAMDLLAAPSQTTPGWREQQGRMLVEAFAVGLPVIASDSGEIPFVVSDAGMVISEREEEAWIDAFERLLGDRELRLHLGALGRERAHATYAWPVIAASHLRFFDELLAGQPALAEALP